MADIRILHNRERAYLKDAISVYLERNESISSDWKKWLEKLQSGLDSDSDNLEVSESNNYINEFYDGVLVDYLGDEFRRARGSITVLNGFSYGNIGRFLKGWSLES